MHSFPAKATTSWALSTCNFSTLSRSVADSLAGPVETGGTGEGDLGGLLAHKMGVYHTICVQCYGAHTITECCASYYYVLSASTSDPLVIVSDPAVAEPPTKIVDWADLDPYPPCLPLLHHQP